MFQLETVVLLFQPGSSDECVANVIGELEGLIAQGWCFVRYRAYFANMEPEKLNQYEAILSYFIRANEDYHHEVWKTCVKLSPFYTIRAALWDVMGKDSQKKLWANSSNLHG